MCTTLRQSGSLQHNCQNCRTKAVRRRSSSIVSTVAIFPLTSTTLVGSNHDLCSVDKADDRLQSCLIISACLNCVHQVQCNGLMQTMEWLLVPCNLARFTAASSDGCRYISLQNMWESGTCAPVLVVEWCHYVAVRHPLYLMEQWPICTIGSHDTAGGHGSWNHHRKCMKIADSAVQSQL